MTPPKTSAPKQVALIQQLSAKIDQSTYEMVSSNETRCNTKLTEGEWLHRVDRFMNDATSGIPNKPQPKELTTALLTKAYSNHLPAAVVKRLTRVLETPVVTTPKPKTIEAVKRATKRILQG
jgi:hypothetical protein